MNFTVIWVPSAERDLAAIWTATADRNAVTRAAHQIDLRLERDAPSEGESRPGGRRVVHEFPLGVTVSVDEPDRTVRVPRAWEVRRRRRP